MEHVYLPELGEGIEKATVACWHASIGDQVSKDDDIVELVTDKATFHVPSGAVGTIKKICFNEGQEVRTGARVYGSSAGEGFQRPNGNCPPDRQNPASRLQHCNQGACHTRL